MYGIDGNNLEVECIKQVDLIEENAMALAEARVVVDILKAKVDRYKRLADGQVRANPRDNGLLKVTEAGVAKAVEGCPNVLKANAALLEGKAEVTRLDAIQTILEHRRRMLPELIKLHGAGYFSTVDSPAPAYNGDDNKSDRPLR